MASKRKQITIETKKVIDASADGKNATELMSEFNLPKSTLYKILQEKSEIQKKVDEGISAKKKRVVKPRVQELDDEMLSWFRVQRSNNVAINGPLLQQKAAEVAESLGVDDYKASNGWLEGFKKRHGIAFKAVQGEEGAVNDLSKWQHDVLHSDLQRYDAEDVFNIDETGLFWKMTPNKTMAFRNERCTGGKKSKERLPVLIGANMSGTEKLPLLIIGKSARPRCFKRATVPLYYEANTKAWMTGAIFAKWMHKWNCRLRKANRYCLVYVDNCTTHPNINDELSNITLKFLLPNTTARSQPMDQGIIQNLKVHYRTSLIKKMIVAIDNSAELKMDVLKAMWMMRRAWANVSEVTIRNCFKRAAFVEDADDDASADDDSSTSAAREQWTELTQRVHATDTDLDAYVHVDEDVATAEDYSQSKLPGFSQPEPVLLSDDEDEETPVTFLDASRAWATFESFMEQNAELNVMKTVESLSDVFSQMHMQHVKQSKVTQFFALL